MNTLFRRLSPYIAIFLFIQTLLRLSLLGRSMLEIEISAYEIFLILEKGFWFDLVTMGFFLLPIAFYNMLLPARKHISKLDLRIDTCIRFIFSFILLFDTVSEHLFWTEFTTRFNFIAVDYLIYTQEVIGNIKESYPVHWVILAVALVAAFLSWVSIRLLPLTREKEISPLKHRALALFAIIAMSVAFNRVSDIDQSQIKDNAQAGEIAANGIYNLFHAFWHNEIKYERFYAMESEKEVEHNARNLLWEKDAGVEFVNKDGQDLTRIVRAKGAEKHKNVILVVMESMSADYMGAYGNTEKLTPNLDALTQTGVSFDQTYATGTRTVRGLEAVTLSIPPTPGQSIIRRPNNDNLFSLGFIFKDRGYDTKFIYGGYGYFDNMNDFFSHNGFDIIDRTSVPKEEIDFANVWGICDEDMFHQSLKEADISYANKKPFLHLIMTTSNHRPYTYPEGRIDIPSHSGRLGGVKYADYSVGKLMEDAKKKPWFKDTVFVFVADHTAGAGGKAELNPEKYHIPMIFYAPDMLKPARFKNISSQIDLAPILLGVLNFSYYTKFYGEDLLHDSDEIGHAFISNYQKIALIKDNGLTVLAPKRKVEQYSWPEVKEKDKNNDSLTNDAIAYYQSASWWKEQHKRIPTIITKGQASNNSQAKSPPVR